MKVVINLSAKEPVLPQFPSYGICILESRHLPGFQMPRSRYDFSEVMLILDGEGWVITGDVRHPVCKGDLVIVPAQEPYSFEDNPGSPLAMFCLCIKPQKEQREIFAPVLPTRFAVIRNFGLSREVSSHLRTIFHEQSQVRLGTPSVVIGQTLLLLSKIARRQEPSGEEKTSNEVELLVRVRDYVAKLETTFHEMETIASAASRLGMSSRSLTHHFRAVTGVSRQQYLQDLRLGEARRLLAESEESITSIAFACGFEDLSNFFRAFRAQEKVSPTQWRKNNAPQGPH